MSRIVRVRALLRAALNAVGLLALAGAIAVFVVGPPTDPKKSSPAPKSGTPAETPPPAPSAQTAEPSEASSPSPLKLPDGFPETAGPYILDSIREENSPDGVISYFSARYTAGEGEAVNVRLVGLTPETSAAFARSTMDALEKSASTEIVSLPDDFSVASGESARLLLRDGAGLFVFSSRDRLLIVAAPDPHTALTIGRSLSGR